MGSRADLLGHLRCKCLVENLLQERFESVVLKQPRYSSGMSVFCLRPLVETNMDAFSSLSQEQLMALVREQATVLRQAQEEIVRLKQEIADLKAGGGGKPQRSLPDFVKSNTPPQTGEERKPRKKRTENFTFHRLPATQEVEHACHCCPDCGHALSGGWEYNRRQVVEIPAVCVEVVDPSVVARRCGVCGQVCTPEVAWQALTGGAGHYGVRLQSLVAYLKSVGRLPVQTIATTLWAVWGLSLSAGTIVGLLHRVAAVGRPTYAGLWEVIRAAPFVHADETGWRQNGQNGYLWSFSTPDTRAFVYDKSRSHCVPERALAGFGGVLVSDFYAGYSYYLRLHQRGWVHLLRDLHDLKQKHPTKAVHAFVGAVRQIYEAAKAFHSPDRRQRMAARLEFQARLLEVAMPYKDAGLPQSVLAGRMVQFESELFTFVEHPEVPSHNNAAERAVRPRVIARKISGGTRSPTGSQTMAVLASLFETWRLRGQNGLEACRQMLPAAQPVGTPEHAGPNSL